MRSVTIKFESTDDRQVDGEFRVEVEKAPGLWVVENSYAVTSGAEGSERKFLLEPNTRIMIVPRGNIEVVYDKEQNAAMTVESFETQPTAEEKQEIEKKRQQDLKTANRQSSATAVSAEQAAERARQRVIEEQQQAEINRKSEQLRQEKIEADKRAAAGEVKTPHPGSDAPTQQSSPTTSTPRGAPQSPAAARQPMQATSATTPGATKPPATPPAPSAPVAGKPSSATGGPGGAASSKDVKEQNSG